MRAHAYLGGLLILGLTVAAPVLAQTREILEFTGPSRQGPVTVKAELFLPEGISGRLPAMVIHHGSGGVGNTREYAYAREFTKMGVASIIPDSFTPRGVKTTVEDQTAVSSNDMIADAFAALKMAAAHPRLDPARIGITGFSKGGSVAMRTGLDVMVRRYVPNGPKFALHVPFYAGCDTIYANMRTTGAPMLVLIGGADTYVGPERCVEAVNRMRAAGSAVASTSPSGACRYDASQCREASSSPCSKAAASGRASAGLIWMPASMPASATPWPTTTPHSSRAPNGTTMRWPATTVEASTPGGGR